MPVIQGQAAPYAPASAIKEIIERHRSKGLPSPVTNDVLERAGISASLIPRTLQALQALDLIESDGTFTSVLEGIRLAPETEYRARLADWLNAAYADALQFVSPSDSETKIRDAFRSYTPVGQQNRMVTLFVGLYAMTGLREEKTKSASTTTPRKTLAPKQSSGLSLVAAMKAAKPPPSSAPNFGSVGLPPPLAGLLASLPKDGWSKSKRDQFYQAFGVILDLCVPIVQAKENTVSATADEDEE